MNISDVPGMPPKRRAVTLTIPVQSTVNNAKNMIAYLPRLLGLMKTLTIMKMFLVGFRYRLKKLPGGTIPIEVGILFQI